MSSHAYSSWTVNASAELDEIVAAHVAVGGVGRGRRYATAQINHAYAVMLSSQFQRYCRDLHTEAADFLVSLISNLQIRKIALMRLIENRKLDSGNPNPGNLGADFGRFDLQLWPAILSYDPRSAMRRTKLEELNEWRNAIAHQHFDAVRLGGRKRLSLHDVKKWRASCNGLCSII